MSQPPIQFRNPGDSTESVLAGEVCLELGGNARSRVARLLLQLTVGRRLLAGMILLVVLPGCLFVAPIEEEPPEEDLPPRIPIEDNLAPPLGNVEVDLQPTAEPFVVFSVEDPNESQTLYFRVLVQYQLILISADRGTISPDDRLDDRVLQFNYEPCSARFERERTAEDDQHIIYIAIADAPFADESELFFPDDFPPGELVSQALRLVPPDDPDAEQRSPAVVAWGIELEGECPE